MIRRFSVAALAATSLILVACGGDDSSSDASGGDCATITDGKLTIATGNPAYSPWVENDAPESGEGFEAAVALAVAAELGYEGENVVWVRTTFDEAIQPGAKNFDFNLQQYSITPERSETVSFSDPYYAGNQAIVALAGSAAEGATSVADLVDVKFGAQAATTSLDFITDVIKPAVSPSCTTTTPVPRPRSRPARSTPSWSTCRPRCTSRPSKSMARP